MKTGYEIEWGLIVRKILGVATQEEEKRFVEWLEADEENRVYFRKAEAYFERYYTGEEERRVNGKEAWGEFVEHTRERKTRWGVRLLKYAAVVAVPLMCSWLAYTFIAGQREKVTEVAVQAILPGATRAVLVLGNGKEIVLRGDDRRDTVAQERNVVINRLGGGLLYNKQGSAVGSDSAVNMIITPRGGEYQVTLSDGTRITLNAESKLVYPVEFSGDVRKVELTGEAYFEVARNESSPFIVETPAGHVKVLGTTFNVSAYTNDEVVQTTLLTGSVSFTTPGKVAREQVIRPGEQVIYYKAGGITQVQKVNTGVFCGWREGKFIMEEERLEDIMRRLARWYDVEVFFQNEEAKDLVFTGDLEKYEKCDVILSFIQLSTNVDFSLKGRTVMVRMRH